MKMPATTPAAKHAGGKPMRAQILLAAALACGPLAVMAPQPVRAQPSSLEEVEITAQEIAPGLAVLLGRGGNMAVSHGPDGTLLIDDQFAPLTARIEAAIAALGAQPVRFLVNTHWHGDHTGGNENFGKAGATIFAHAMVRERMSSEQRRGDRVTPPSPEAALPIVTYDQGIRFHLNGETIDVRFLGGGHTDGDSIVLWQKANAVHMGDLFFNTAGYPFVDIASGGNVDALMRSLDLAIAMIGADTVVIPGHGAITDKPALIAYRAMIGEAVRRVENLHGAGLTLEEAIARKPLADLDRGEGFIGPDDFVTAIWQAIEQRH